MPLLDEDDPQNKKLVFTLLPKADLSSLYDVNCSIENKNSSFCLKDNFGIYCLMYDVYVE